MDVTIMQPNSHINVRSALRLSYIILIQLQCSNAWSGLIEREKEHFSSITTEEYLLSTTDDWDFLSTFPDDDTAANQSVPSTTSPHLNVSNSTTYAVDILSAPNSPILSYINHTAAYQQVYNPCWISKGNESGLVVLVQNCSLQVW